MFTREKFQWTLKEASLFDSGSLVISIIGSAIGITIMKKKLGFTDVWLAIIAVGSLMLDSLIKATAQSPTSLYVAAIICMLNMLTTPVCRSLVASVVPKNEIGKVYSMSSSFEALAGLFAAPLYTFIYTQTFRQFAGAFYFVTASLCFANLILIISVKKMKET